MKYLPVITNPDKILCVGINYKAHQEETGRDPTSHPTIFVRFAAAQIGHEQPMIRPKESDRLDFEGEIALVIGKRGRRISVAKALEHVAGFSCYNDGSVRDFQRHTTQFTPGKNFTGTGGFGPWLMTKRRMRRSRRNGTDDAPERRSDAERDRLAADLRLRRHHRVLFDVHRSRSGRRDRHAARRAASAPRAIRRCS